jgi:hypothetical protein
MNVLTRRTILRATAASAAVVAPSVALGAVIKHSDPDPVVKLVADFYQAERDANEASKAEEVALEALPDTVANPRITVTLRNSGSHTLHNAKEIEDAFHQEYFGDKRRWQPAWSPELREAWELWQRLGPQNPAPEARAAAAEFERLYKNLTDTIEKEWRDAKARVIADFEKASEAAEDDQDRLGYTAIHERTEAAWDRYFELQRQIQVTSATTPAGLAARLRVLASICTEGSVPNDDFVVSIADDAARLAGGVA